jgi:hypothetical protein
VIATHGRALYVLDDVAPLRELSAETMREPLHLYPASVGQIHGEGGGSGNLRGGAGEFIGQSRPKGVLLTYSLNAPGLPLPDDDKERERKEKERAEARKAAPAEPDPEKAPGAMLKEDPPLKDEDNDEKAKEPTKVKIEIADASGKVVRTMEGPAKLGLNRAVWDLGRDAFRQPETDNRGFQRDQDSGPEVPPGTYGVTVRHGDHEAKGSVKVAAAPAIQGTDADWQAREEAVVRIGKLQNATVEAIERVSAARKDVDVVLKKLQPKDKKADGKENPNKALMDAARALQKKLNALDRRLWVGPDVKGIVDDQTLLARIGSADFPVLSSWAAPSATARAFLDQAEAAARKTLADVNKLFAEDVAAFREKVEAAKIGLLADQTPISIE